MSPAPSEPAPTAGETLDSSVLAELREIGGDELVHELMAVFVERTPERLRAAESCHAAGDAAGAAAALHSLRSAAGTVGARRLSELAGRLERAARGLGEAALAPGLVELRRETEAVLAEARGIAGPAP